MSKHRILHFRFGSAGALHTVRGRVAWMLAELVRAGATGLTESDYPGPRISEYVRRLRKEGVHIETVREKHGGEFAGTHARYVLRSPIIIVSHSTPNSGGRV